MTPAIYDRDCRQQDHYAGAVTQAEGLRQLRNGDRDDYCQDIHDRLQGHGDVAAPGPFPLGRGRKRFQAYAIAYATITSTRPVKPQPMLCAP